MARRALVTGSAGFIGYHLCRRLLADGWEVTGLDAMTTYYDVTLKERRLAQLQQSPGFRAVTGLVETPGLVAELADGVEVIIHLAAQAGVRYSIDHPRSYVEANLIGTYEVLEAARATKPAHLLIASTSSVYGANTDMPYAEGHKADHPMSFYAATKKAGEAMGHSYAHLYTIPTTMFRFFTVYGPWGRPDMALFKFVKAVLAGDPIDIYNHGDMRRDFTYVDDLVEGISRLIDAPPTRSAGPMDSLSPVAPYRIVNIGNGTPVGLMDFVQAVEEATGRTADKRLLPMQPGDVPATWADASLIEALTGPLPRTDIRDGVRRFVDWYRDFYRV
ncbi:NAD-dependent epimerase/dehydratase family protein [Fuscovulum ytuae]|uniref:NAD-dependent epimerase/dehydratase family protein n=1 Tax=Fuscovulum ytuae TaxID=3042299 RepID=A0ABY8QBR5_9RHOB|nr:NAD-dependent epimerase/dehydratase family protein [Fuscovulum sp. YMD61]WGV17702.1 NAD-dependent epimerase/dehydratase family protein [Fuscovulum sp. YMD61]